MGYEYEIHYRLGCKNVAADALSWRPNSHTLNYLFMPQVAIWEEIKRATSEDEYIKKIAQITQTQAAGRYSVRNGLIFFKDKVVVPRKLRETILHEARDTKMRVIPESYARTNAWHNNFIGL